MLRAKQLGFAYPIKNGRQLLDKELPIDECPPLNNWSFRAPLAQWISVGLILFRGGREAGYSRKAGNPTPVESNPPSTAITCPLI